MKRLIRWLVAGIVLAFVAAAVGADGSEFTVQLGETDNGDPYLVDQHGKVLYVFIPYGQDPIPVKETWSEEVREFFSMWEPLTVDSPDALRIDEELVGDHVFYVYPIQRGSTFEYQVFWGGADTDEHPFWPLYTFRGDRPVSQYAGINEAPGYAAPLWVAAAGDPNSAPKPDNLDRLEEAMATPGGPGGDSIDGGP